MKYAADFREEARKALSGKWGRAIGTGLVASFLGAGIQGCSGSSGGSSSGEGTGEGSLDQLISYLEDPDLAIILMAVAGGIAAIGIILSLVHLIVGSPVTLGYCKFNLHLIDRDEEAEFSDLFTQFHRIGPAIALQVLRGVYTFLWSLLFVIPGIVKAYSYSMAAYIMYENPGMTPNDAITESRELMDGNKWRLFCLELSFIGWAFLCVFTCGIGFFWLFPYQETAVAAFYREIWREKYGIPVVAEPIVEGTSYEEMVADRYREPKYKDEN